MNDGINLEHFFAKMDKKIFELEFELYIDKDDLSDKLNNFAVREARVFIEHMKEPWEAFSRGINERFNKLNGDDLSPEQRKLFLKEGLQFVAPKNIVRVLDEVFNISRLEEMKHRYEHVMDGLENNKFEAMVRRYRVSDGTFVIFYEALMAETKNLPEVVQVLSERYVHLLRELQRVEEDDGAELYAFGAGILGSLLAGPLGGMATRSIVRSATDKQGAIHEAIDQIYDGLIDLYNVVEQAFARMHKKVLYIYYTAYRGLIYRVEQDLKPYHYTIVNVNFKTNALELSLMSSEQERLLNWYQAIEGEVCDAITDENYTDANIISEQLLQFFMKNPHECEIKYENHCLAYQAIVLRYTVLAAWLKQSMVMDSSEQREDKLRNVHRFYRKLFDDMTFGINDIRVINDVDVPLMLETVFHYVHVTEILAQIVPEESFQLRSHTIHSLLEYVERFSEKRIGKESFAFEHEYIDRRTLALIKSYQSFLTSIDVPSVTSNILKKHVHHLNHHKIANEYDVFVQISNVKESAFYQYIIEDEQQEDQVGEPNEHLHIRQREQHDDSFDESVLEEELPLLQLYGFLEYRERTLRGDMEDNEAGRTKWMRIWNDRIQFLEHYLIAKTGDAEAQFTVGEWYAAGKGVEVNDERSFYWMLEAAQQHYLQAVALIPKLYRDGIGVEANAKKSFKWMEELTSLTNSPLDQFTLGTMHIEGYGTRVHRKKGYNLYRRAAEQGYVTAYFKLGELDEEDDNIEGAKEWYKEAVKHGHVKAQERLQKIEAKELKQKYLKFAKIVTPLIIVTAALAYYFAAIYLPKTRYETVNELMLAGKFEEAVPILEKIQGYKDSSELLKEAEINVTYRQAELDLADGYYDEVISALDLLNGYKDSFQLIKEAKYLRAKEWFDGEEYDVAIELFAELNGFEDSEELMNVAQENLYNEAMTEINNGNYNEARQILFKIVNYRDARNELYRLNNLVAQDINTDIGGYQFTLSLNSDGTVVGDGSNRDGQLEFGDWENIVQIAAGSDHTVGLQADGNVKATGLNFSEQLDVENWSNIVEIAAGRNHTVGLSADGHVYHAGFDADGLADVYRWSDIVTIHAHWNMTIGLKADGTVLVAGRDVKHGAIDVSDWEDIIDLSINGDRILGLKGDGTTLLYDLQ